MNEMLSFILTFTASLPLSVKIIGLTAAVTGVSILILHRYSPSSFSNRNRHQSLEHLIKKLNRWKRLQDAQSLLQLDDFQGAYPVFLAALKDKHIAGVFSEWLEETPGITAIRTMAVSGKGRNFDGRKARELLDNAIDRVREISGDPEWPARYFALCVLLGDEDTQAQRLVSEAFHDSHPLLRQTAVTEARMDSDELFNHLISIALDDPVPEVRRCARNRIDLDFPNRWKLNLDRLNSHQYIHVLEQLRTESREDENAAVHALSGSLPELQMTAAQFLERSGMLDKIIAGADLGDIEDWNRRFNLLHHALAVGVTGFLSVLKSTKSNDVQMMGARLLQIDGDVELIAPLAQRVFAHWRPGCSESMQLYKEVITLICSRGLEKSQSLLGIELRKQRYQNDILEFILPNLPPHAAPVYRDILLEFLVDPVYSAEKAYLDIMSRLPYSMFINTVLNILESHSAKPRPVRLRALRVLGVWHLNQNLQTVIENLPLLSTEHYPDFIRYFSAVNEAVLIERASFILASPDVGIRAALISCLPQNCISALSEEIRSGIRDSSPEIRIASARALSRIKGFLPVEESVRLLKDPVERVRQESAILTGTTSPRNILETLEQILWSTDESIETKKAVLTSLSVDSRIRSIEILVHFLDQGNILEKDVLAALTVKTCPKSLIRLAKYFQHSNSVLKNKLIKVFTAMGKDCEKELALMLREITPNLKPFLVNVLTSIGYVETLIHRLGNRSPAIRREAAELLSIIGTESAYRGIVLAVRDPDTGVRIHAVKALEALANQDSELILKFLKYDPDRKVRQYTQWAMKRMEANNIP